MSRRHKSVASLAPKLAISKKKRAETVLAGAVKLFAGASDALKKAEAASAKLDEAHGMIRALEQSGSVKSEQVKKALGAADKILSHAEKAGQVAGRAEKALSTAEKIAKGLLGKLK